MANWRYNYEAISADGFVAQLVRYIGTGHFFFVTGQIPEGKDVVAVDEKILSRFGIAKPRWQRARDKQAGIASVHYLRFERFIVLIASHGKHKFFEEHTPAQIQDCRRVGLKFEGYSIRFGFSNHTNKHHTFVRLDAETYANLKAYFMEISLRRSVKELEDEFRSVWYQRYRPIREQLFNILRIVNRKRKLAGLTPVDHEQAIATKRRIRKSFLSEKRTDVLEAVSQ